uniref:RING-type domain-containing protein n=1 Tax=Romanomermis culicivorax TaxID=13658 RepID=A0A915ILA7_ROMCU
MTEDHLTTVLRDDLQKLFECPVCVQVFRNPKLLPCGHSVCADCCAQLNRDRISLLCPVCRRPSTTLADRLPINFGLRDLVNHYVDSDDQKKFSCANCDRKVTENDCWSCDDCSKIVCSFCAIKLHTLHTLKEIKDLLRDKESEINKWREDVSQIGKQIQSMRQQIDANEPRMKTGLRLLTSTVTKKLMPQLENERKNLISELR